MTQKYLISVEDLARRFPTPDGKGATEVFGELWFGVSEGEFVCLIGPSGCGKSTLLKIIADQLNPTTGTIQLNSDTPEIIRKQKRIAWMAQNPALLPWKNVRENIELS